MGGRFLQPFLQWPPWTDMDGVLCFGPAKKPRESHPPPSLEKGLHVPGAAGPFWACLRSGVREGEREEWRQYSKKPLLFIDSPNSIKMSAGGM